MSDDLRKRFEAFTRERALARIGEQASEHREAVVIVGCFHLGYARLGRTVCPACGDPLTE